ncbi:methyl-accepting chemotaxis protein [Blastococcus sp. BMG 814]|uniref:Methyl-accepting chemotaxis protein n=1 Tax=Blastococcus carthaginiensis TaxID=3050034 RepID=A0ABT9IH66_9ACTN|nr:methyl-accepting chemotaxis protein [Blastococcus carthaginiensis]MDP5184542.1 methyl-accepting chemotaxis protein [Blastococcus carthaginiensis]
MRWTNLPSWVVPSNTGIRTKVVALAVASVAVTGVAMGGVSAWQSSRFADDAARDMDALVEENISRAARGAYDLVATQGASTAMKVDYDLNAARYVLQQSGSFAIDGSGRNPVTWDAKNQMNGQVTPVALPRVLVGGEWLGQNTDMAVRTPVVDDIMSMVGATVTLFQKTPEGNFLRVATNVQAASGSRAIGTYIPAVNPDGKPNPVAAAVSSGQTYRGNAFVVDSWLVSAYEPILGPAGDVVGVLYVGVKQTNLPALRQGLESTTIGENGHIEVYGGTGDRAGTVLVSPDGAQDGEQLIDATDAEGTPYVQQIVDAALPLQDGEQATVRYVDPEEGPTTARVSYYAPWDWVITAVTRDADFAGATDALAEGRTSMVWAMVLAALAIAVVGGLIALWVGRRLTQPLTRLRDRMAEIADGEGDLTQRMDDSRDDEVGQLSGAFNRFVDKVAGTVRDIHRCAQEVASSAAGVSAVADGLAHRASRSRDQAQGAHGVASEISSSVSSAAAGAEEMGASITEIARSAAEAAEVGRQAASLAEATETTIAALGASSAEIGDVVKVISGVAEQTNLLALNATIEAARAGDAGKGFAVVANEVKDLAQEAAKASEEIAQRVQGIQSETTEAVRSISRIAEVVRAINDHQTTIASAVEEQTATTRELSRSVATAAEGAGAVTTTLTSVSRDADDSASDVERARSAAQELDGLSRELNRLLGAFTV